MDRGQVDVERPTEPDRVVVVSRAAGDCCAESRIRWRGGSSSASSFESISSLISGRNTSRTSASSRTACRLSAFVDARLLKIRFASSRRAVTKSASALTGTGASSSGRNSWRSQNDNFAVGGHLERLLVSR